MLGKINYLKVTLTRMMKISIQVNKMNQIRFQKKVKILILKMINHDFKILILFTIILLIK